MSKLDWWRDVWQIIVYPAIFWLLFALLCMLVLLVYFGVVAPGLWDMLSPSPAEYLKARDWSAGRLCEGFRA